MSSFITIKTIDNNHYFYEQTPHRHGENTTPIMKFLGPVFRRKRKGEKKREPIQWTNADIEFERRDPEGYGAYLERTVAKNKAFMEFLDKTGVYREEKTTCDLCDTTPEPISATPVKEEKNGTPKDVVEL